MAAKRTVSSTVSIFIPVYNRKLLIKRSVESALAQTYTDLEIVISDNYSTDGTWEQLQKYAESDRRIKLTRTQSNLGPFANWTHGLKQCQGEYV